MKERMLARAAIAGFAVGVIGLGVVAIVSDDDSPERLPALSLGSTAGEEDKAAAAALSMPAGTIEYRLQATLPDLPDRARAWTLGRDGEASRVEALARALGLDAPVTVADDGWTVSAGGRVLRVERQPGLPWYFSPYGGDGGCGVAGAEPGVTRSDPDAPVASDTCVTTGGGAAGSSGTASSGTVSPEPGDDPITIQPCPVDATCVPGPEPSPLPEPERPADLPTKEGAEATARATFSKAGIDLDGATARVDDGFTQWFVEFEPQVGGLPTLGFSTGASVGPKGVIDAHGWLAQPQQADEYPLVTAAAGFARLKESPFGIGPQPLIAEDAPVCLECAPPTPVVRTITGVRLGLVFAPLLEPGDEGRALLVPAFLFDIDDGGLASAAGSGSIVPVLAVEDEFLPKPVEQPRPGATEPGIEPGATEPAPPQSVPGATEPAVEDDEIPGVTSK